LPEKKGSVMYRRASIVAWTILILLAFGRAALAQLWIEPRCKRLPFDRIAPVVALPDGSLLKVEGNSTRTSGDDGKTWSPRRPIYAGPGPGVPSEEDYCCQLLRTRSGAIIVVYMDILTSKWQWDGNKNEAAAGARLDVWAVRSLDGGKTWIDRQKILDGYCGALIGAIQTSAGQIVVPMQDMLDRNRHVVLTNMSADDGKTWRRSNVIDLGGRGGHDGAFEPTIAELSAGRLLMLIRTNLDRFWEACSDDHGRYWREIRPSRIDASSSPGNLRRLSSGRLALVWNRLCAEGKGVVRRAEFGLSEPAASWQRAELSLAFSDDDAKTWTKPVVIARMPGGGLAYPFLFERRPGEIWIATHETQVCLSLKEADFVKKP
jgi:sialidase-1